MEKARELDHDHPGSVAIRMVVGQSEEGHRVSLTGEPINGKGRVCMQNTAGGSRAPHAYPIFLRSITPQAPVVRHP
jgi:hypothetical protein